MAAEETLFQAITKQIPAIADSVSEQMRSAVTNRLTSEVARMQKAAGEAEALRQTAATEAAALERAIVDKRAAGQALDEVNASKRQQGVELDAVLAAKAAQIHEQHAELERVTAAVVATRALRPPVAV